MGEQPSETKDQSADIDHHRDLGRHETLQIGPNLSTSDRYNNRDVKREPTNPKSPQGVAEGAADRSR